MFNLVNPIPQSIRDAKKLSLLFKKYSIVPYYGSAESTSHSMLQLISDLTSLSPSHTACKEDIKTWSFGSGVEIIPRRTARKREDEESLLSDTEKNRFEKQLIDIGIDLAETIECTKVLFDHLKDSGNAYLLIRLNRINSTWSVKLFVIHYRMAAYLLNKSGRPNKIISTEYWSEDWWKDKPPFVAFASQLNSPFVWNQKSNGTLLETIVHIKRKADESPYYGRPGILPGLESMYVEQANQSRDCKIAGSEFVSKGLLAFEEVDPSRFKGSDEDKQELFKSKMRILRKLTTSEGEEAKSFAGVEFPYGGQPPVWIPLEISRDKDFDEHQVNKASSFIYALWRWDKQLTGFSPVKSNIGGNVFIDLFTVKNVSVIMPEQRFWENVWGKVFSEIGKMVYPNEDMHTIKFPNLIDELVERLSSLKNGPSKNPVEDEDPLDSE